MKAPDGSLPPLLIKVHGGPTAKCSQNMNLKHQYFTSRGFGILDVNYRGSTGYGKQYRHLLRKRWENLNTWKTFKRLFSKLDSRLWFRPLCLADSFKVNTIIQSAWCAHHNAHGGHSWCLRSISTGRQHQRYQQHQCQHWNWADRITIVSLTLTLECSELNLAPDVDTFWK